MRHQSKPTYRVYGRSPFALLRLQTIVEARTGLTGLLGRALMRAAPPSAVPCATHLCQLARASATRMSLATSSIGLDYPAGGQSVPQSGGLPRRGRDGAPGRRCSWLCLRSGDQSLATQQLGGPCLAVWVEVFAVLGLPEDRDQPLQLVVGVAVDALVRWRKRCSALVSRASMEPRIRASDVFLDQGGEGSVSSVPGLAQVARRLGEAAVLGP